MRKIWKKLLYKNQQKSNEKGGESQENSFDLAKILEEMKKGKDRIQVMFLKGKSALL